MPEFPVLVGILADLVGVVEVDDAAAELGAVAAPGGKPAAGDDA